MMASTVPWAPIVAFLVASPLTSPQELFYSAGLFGLPFYINTEASLPLIRAMLDSVMSQGAALAFLITGAGTSLGALGGALTIARWRVIGIVIGTLWLGSILIGFAYNFLVI